MARKKLLKRISYLDFVIIFALLFFAVGLYSRYNSSRLHRENASSVSADVVFEMHGVALEDAAALLSDTTLYTSHGEKFGELMIDSVSVRPSVLHITMPDGSISSLESKTLYDVEAVVLCRGAYTEGGFFLSGVTYIAPNMTMMVKSSVENFEIYLTNIEIF